MRVSVVATAIVCGMIGCPANRTAEAGDTVPQTQPGVDATALYTQEGTDPAFQSIIDEKRIPVGMNSTEGITGSAIRVKHELIPAPATGKNPIPKDIHIHTLGNSLIRRQDFARWTRWYQEDGSTQIFRLFPGERNVRNSRELAARIEAFSALNWQQGEWHEWEGTYTIVKPHGGAIFQVKNNINDWAVAINLSNRGDITVNHRRHQEDKVIATGMTGKSFVLKVRDNGRDYEVYYDGKKVGAGHYDRPEGRTAFRWGIYVGKNEVKHDAMIFVTGATFR
jgi:hypothetical protein